MTRLGNERHGAAQVLDELARFRREHGESQAALGRELQRCAKKPAYREQVWSAGKKSRRTWEREDHCKGTRPRPTRPDPALAVQGKMVVIEDRRSGRRITRTFGYSGFGRKVARARTERRRPLRRITKARRSAEDRTD